MRHKLLLFVLVFAGALLMASCNNNSDDVKKVSKHLLTGKAQKGPFAIGSKVSIFELDESFSQTGKVFTTTIIDNEGTFEQRNMNFNSQYVEIRVDGFFFNEVRGVTEQSTLTLTSLANLSEVDNVNVNILTTIERPRILYLIENEALSFSDARQKAHSEVINIFTSDERQTPNSDQLSINSNAQLLAISSIAMGWHPVSDITSLITSMAADIQKDGVLNDEKIKSELRTNYAGLNVADILGNLSKHGLSYTYSEEDLQRELDNFDFVSQDYPLEKIEYPEIGTYGENVLAKNDGDELQIGEYSFTSLNGYAPLKIVVTSNDIEWYMNIIRDNWEWTTYKSGNGSSPNQQTFTVSNPSLKSDLQFIVTEQGSLTFTSYEFGSSTPTQQKTLIFQKSDLLE